MEVKSENRLLSRRKARKITELEAEGISGAASVIGTQCHVVMGGVCCGDSKPDEKKSIGGE